MAQALTGGCLCSAVRYEIVAEPLQPLVCHCKNCQRQTGSIGSTAVIVPKAAIEIDGTLTRYEHLSDSGHGMQRHFCPLCGSPIMTTLDRVPDIVAVKVGTFDDTSWFRPQINIWTDSAQPWMPIDPACLNYPQNPT